LLEESNYTATTAHTTDEAFQKLKVALPDMILLDVRLPTIGGLEFLEYPLFPLIYLE
jgi:CheY-like chemotaxis protein